MVDVEEMRQFFGRDRLLEEGAGADPLDLFRVWFEAAAAASIYANAMILATVDRDGAPSARVVLMKSYGPEGLSFFTNRDSAKGRAMAADPRVACCFYWSEHERQVRLEGRVAECDDEATRRYFTKRPRESRIAAWASPQSEPLADRAELERRYTEAVERFAGDGEIPPPPFWGGYLLSPDAWEFWQGRENRLHDRLRYERDGETWRRTRLAP